MSTNNIVVIAERRQEPFGAVALFVLVGIVALIVAYFWQIVIVLIGLLTVFIFWLLFQDRKMRMAQIKARADQQLQWLAEGDPRGIYGNEFSREGFE